MVYTNIVQYCYRKLHFVSVNSFANYVHNVFVWRDFKLTNHYPDEGT